MTTELHVLLGDRSYWIHFGRGQAPLLAQMLEPFRKSRENFLIVTDENVSSALNGFINALSAAKPLSAQNLMVVPAGEASKNSQLLARIWDHLAAAKVDRSGCLIALGGGVIGDLAGFAAATYLRGIPFLQVPTTLLAMVDSSVGGKTGINIPAGKNLVGAFWQPLAVLADFDALASLPSREFSAGMAEVIKYGLLYDSALFETLCTAPRLEASSPLLEGVVHRCCQIKAEIVAGDERETAAEGGRALLNLGHTFGHAIENAAGYGTYLHGEAVAIGLVLALKLSLKLSRMDHLPSLITLQDVERTVQLLRKYRLPVDLLSPCDEHVWPALAGDDLMNAMTRDKKVRSGKMRFVTLEKVGKAVTTQVPDEALIRQLWKECGAR